MAQYVTSPPTVPILSHLAVAMAIQFPDESCPPMRCIRHSNRSGSLILLTAINLPTNLSAVGFIKLHISFLPRLLYLQESLMRAHVFGSRLRVVLTLYLKLGLNSTLDVAVRV